MLTCTQALNGHTPIQQQSAHYWLSIGLVCAIPTWVLYALERAWRSDNAPSSNIQRCRRILGKYWRPNTSQHRFIIIARCGVYFVNFLIVTTVFVRETGVEVDKPQAIFA